MYFPAFVVWLGKMSPTCATDHTGDHVSFVNSVRQARSRLPAHRKGPYAVRDPKTSSSLMRDVHHADAALAKLVEDLKDVLASAIGQGWQWDSFPAPRMRACCDKRLCDLHHRLRSDSKLPNRVPGQLQMQFIEGSICARLYRSSPLKPEAATRAARISLTDVRSLMIGEFLKE
jgi:hypothetical protein